MILEASDFNLQATLESGQVFGFARQADGSFRGRLKGREASIRQAGKMIVVEGPSLPSRGEIEDFFDLRRDLSGIYVALEAEPPLRPALDAFRGLRLIRQDSWEALACFILSSNNNVKRIQLIWRTLSSRLNPGTHAFPTAAQVARCHERTLREFGLGYRAPFLQRSALFVAANPGSLDAIRESSYDEARQRVIAFPGIGPKVADCVLLYGFQKMESFPVDVWILRAMRKLYFRNRRVSEDVVGRFARRRWGTSAGYVQQYVFHGARLGVL